MPAAWADSRRPVLERAERIDSSSSAVQSYRSYLARQHAAFEAVAKSAIPQTRALYRYDMVIGGVALLVPERDVARLASLPGVRAVYRSELRQPDTEKSPTFIGAKKLWGQLGGPDDAGEGVIVGVLDTGIWPEHPSFADPDPKGKAYPAPGGFYTCQFSGGANPGAPFTCNNKLIGAYRFQDAYDACGTCSHPAEEFSSARDSDGHGSHTASTAAGNRAVKADVYDIKRGMVSGIAPRAHVIAYKVCGPSGCPTADMVAAIQQAILDGADVINFSISGGSQPYLDDVELAFRDAYAAGIFVAASAGNSGPGANTTDHRSGWVTTVAASTEKREFQSKIKLSADNGDKLMLRGASVTPGIGDATPVVLSTSVGDDFCGNGTPDAAFAGKIVACKRGGGIARVAKGFNVLQRGAVGMLLYNDPGDPSQTDVLTDNHFIPAVQILAAAGTDLVNFVNTHSGVAAKFTKGSPAGGQGDVIAGFSSRGGAGLRLGIAKPDITAPGVQILAGNTPEGFAATHLDGELFQVIAGTSMASPHVAGAGALLRDLHPSWSPGRIKSALMTTASAKKLFKEDGVTPFDPFDAGSGRLLLKTAGNPGITFDVPVQDYNDHSADLWNVNYPSVYIPTGAPNVVSVTRTAHSELAVASTWAITVTAPVDLPVTVPAQIAVPAGGDAAFSIGIDKSALGPNVVRHALLELKYKSQVARLPITAVGTAPLPNLTVTAVSGSSPVVIGGPFDVAQTIANNGTVGAGPFFTIFALSLDAALSPNDVVLAFCDYAGGLAAGSSDSGCAGTLANFDPSLPAGSYRLLAIVDSAVEVDESNEGDNLLATAGDVTLCNGQCVGSDCGCNQTSPVNESLTPCSGVVDTWAFDVAAGESIDIRADTLDSETAADLRFDGSCPGQPFTADDEGGCTFPPPAYECPQATFVASGTGQCTVLVYEASASCANPATANYQLLVTRAGTDAEVALVLDDQ